MKLITVKENHLAVLVAGLAALNFSNNANANVIFNDARETGNQWGYTVGMDFTVNSAVTVSALGTFDSNLTPYTDPVTTAQINTSLEQGISSGDAPVIRVGIFNTLTGVEVSPTANFFYNDPNIANYYAIAGSIFQNITPFDLGPGTYTIVASGYNYLLAFGDIKYIYPPSTPTFDTLLGALSFGGGSARVNGTGFGIPAFGFPTYYSEPESSPDFLAGTFIANAPDAGSTAAMLGGALATLGALRRKLSR